MFERQDWELFRTIDGLSHKAGVPREKIAALIAKELADNALDDSTACKVGLLDGDGFFVHDNGPGLEPSQVPDLFSIKRPLRSTKLLRLPKRGALGNGLRVVAGAVLATGGKLRVYTGGQAMNLVPCADGTTSVEVIGAWDAKGTRVEVQLGPDAGPIDLQWAEWAIIFSHGQSYKGKTSPHWYTSTDLHELCLAAKNTTVSDLISQFESCASKTGAITSGFKAKQATDVTLDDAKILLDRMQNESIPVKPHRLGCSRDENGYLDISGHYAKKEGTFKLESNHEVAEIPYVIEAWTKFEKTADISVLVNRTPITGEVRAYHDKTRLAVFGCGLKNGFDVGRRPPHVCLSIITPYMPITTDGKSPDLSYLLDGIGEAIRKSIRIAKRNASNGPVQSQKYIVLNNLEEAIDKTSGSGLHRYNLRQLYYTEREIVKRDGGGELTYGNFTKIITDYEFGLGRDLPWMYRDDRGIIYHPHKHDTISLGTRMVEVYEPPDWTFNKVLFIEKEGFFQILQDEKWPEIHDCALLTSKGQPTRATRDLIDGLGDGKEEITFYCIHDADAYGTTIYQSLQDATKARPARKVKVINLGLELEEGLDMGLEPEDVEKPKDPRPVANYVSPECGEWLQTHRIELNTMTTPQFLQWLDDKMEEFGRGKLIPPEETLDKELHETAREKLAQDIKERILRENDAEGQIERAFEQLKSVLDSKAKELIDDVTKDLTTKPDQSWRDPVHRAAYDLVERRITD